MTQLDWAESQAAVIAQEVRRLRGKRSAQWLSDQTQELGYVVSRSVITDLENGRRKYVTTAELVVLARALNTIPIALMFPPQYGASFVVLPNMVNPVSGILALQWFSGALSEEEVFRIFGGDIDEIRENCRPVRLVREMWDLEVRRYELTGAFTSTKPGSRAARALLDEIGSVQDQIEIVRRSIERTGADGGGEDGG